VPDFQHITNKYEEMQNEVADRPITGKSGSRKQVKNFTIRKLQSRADVRKSTQTVIEQNLREAQRLGNSQSQASMPKYDPNSLLTAEEQAQL
jgi:hypothetical protein